MTIGKRKGATAKGVGGGVDSVGDKFGGSLSKADHWYIQQAFGVNANPGIAPSTLEASGGIISDYSDPSPGKVYRAHIFTSSGTFDVTSLSSDPSLPNNVEYLVVGGGGGGGGSSGQSGGGGAGGFRTNLSGHPLAAAAYPVSVTSYTVTVGGGGAGGPVSGGEYASQGGNSEFYPTPQSYPDVTRVRSDGGGAGAGYAATPDPVMNGGSGGGAVCSPTPYAGGTSLTDPNHPQVQGYAAGDGTPDYQSPYAGAGGGGAGRAGAPDNPTTPLTRSTGGYGLQALIGGPPANPQTIGAPGPDPANGYFAGGGGGGRYNGTSAAGGYGGGGDGAPPSPSRGNPGTVSTGGGGGGGGHPYLEGGNGGSGIVVVRYQIGSLTGTAKATGGNISFYGGKTIHVFTGTGTFASANPFNETCECVIIGGGGGTGNPPSTGSHGGGGGGAGAVYDRDNVSLSLSGPWTFNVTIGGGGGYGSMGTPGSNGSPSAVAFPTGTLTAPGGGYGGISVPGGPPYGTEGNPGGAGGGGSNYSAPEPVSGGTGDGAPWPGTPGNDPGSGWGGDGGAGLLAAPAYAGGGGGGAQDGTDAPPSPSAGGPGGGGYKIPTTYQNPLAGYGYAGPGGDMKFWFAGGGGGGVYATIGLGGKGGNAGSMGFPYAGAGDGGYRAPVAGAGRGANAQANSGAGAGGGGGGNANPGGDGGSGIVLIAYPT